MIQIDQLTYCYPDHPTPCLAEIDLTIDAGSFTLIMGPSGSGKSTLLRCLNGLVPHFSGGEIAGRVRVLGEDPLRVGPRVMSRHVGMVFQSPEAQFVLDRVEDEIAFALEHAGLPRAEMRLRVEEVLDLLDLAPLRDRELRTLSGGERQRVAIAAALALRPTILALDEPTSQLDPQSAEDVLQALVRLNSDLGLTVVLVEHRVERVLPFVDQVVVFDAAGHVRSGPPRDILPEVELCPPVVEVARAYGWSPLPLSVKEARRFAAKITPTPQAAPSANPVATGEPYLRITALEAGYEAKAVLHNLDLNVWPGEIVVLMGRNGVGKSTLLRCIVGLLRPQRGNIWIRGQNNRGRSVAAISRELACLPQESDSLLFADSVAEELRVTLRNHGQTENGQVQTLLGQLGLERLSARYPRDLSVGERQRVALGAITVTQPGGLLLDEPTRGLDYAAKTALANLLRQWRNQGAAIMLVTHDVEFSATIADRVLVLGRGGLVADGPPQSVLANSPLFAPQVARLFPGSGWLTVADALAFRPAQ
ncbi:MAG: energy-coupling factor ABC transporter ATP-binding protein [Candidatus Viridilinea halotolerans]|uniref:Energy-coupling factor ABC transporter ATP-binding protein n=1 Tax=Candidatus Viridilinea halotolerans TaxID=2491704 RepID=A0A426U453_9CHLR|nr:MAG: energy-coupling factor ABC transporter ATP-binding protein [Candidatus Viridilinea halotolerans]